MSLGALLKLGISEALRSGWDDYVASDLAGVDVSPNQLKAALLVVPDVLSALDGLVFDDEAPLAARALAPMVMTYLFKEDDLVPVTEGAVVRGIVDDAYLALRAALEVSGSSPHLDADALTGHLGALELALPADVLRSLGESVERAITEVTAGAESLVG